MKRFLAVAFQLKGHGWVESMNFETISIICESSVVLLFWNLSLAGVLKKSSSTVTVVPFGLPILEIFLFFPPFSDTFKPSGSFVGIEVGKLEL